ncbi:MAG TPA: YqaJ viral recombinase family protein [Myxococcota bacterium]|nr:YqaJ viral recombinase family protein [Myxococcota bacterium]
MLKVYPDIVQGTEAWFAARLGMPTASEFSAVMAEGKGAMRETYMNRLAGERLTGKVSSNYTNAAMERGKEMEDEARRNYAFTFDVELEAGTFMTNGPGEVIDAWGYSPDSLKIGRPGLVEIKTTEPHLLAAMSKAQDKDAKWFPPQHKAQCQGGLLVSERDHIDLVIYWPDMPMLLFTAYRDVAYIRRLEEELYLFNKELDALEATLRAKRAAQGYVERQAAA